MAATPLENKPTAPRLDHLDAIRGLAALGVCLFHFSHGGKLLPNSATLQAIPKYGYLGVEVFFVLSGFVIPWLLWKNDYKIEDFGRFFAKRLVRLYPPFLAANLLIFLLFLASRCVPGFQGSLEPIDPWHWMLSLSLDSVYLTGILQRPWISVVAWTLAIEVQFYIVAGLVMACLPRWANWRTAVVLLALLLLCFIVPDERFVTRFLPFFVLGWSGAFQTYHPKAKLPWVVATVACSVILIVTSSLQFGLAISTFAVILVWKWPVPKWLLFLGAISYSLYLIHVPIGGRVVNIGLRFAEPGTPLMLLVMLLALILSLGCSIVFWRCVELPSQLLSRTMFPRTQNRARVVLNADGPNANAGGN